MPMLDSLNHASAASVVRVRVRVRVSLGGERGS
jgi:hypothetical protein